MHFAISDISKIISFRPNGSRYHVGSMLMQSVIVSDTKQCNMKHYQSVKMHALMMSLIAFYGCLILPSAVQYALNEWPHCPSHKSCTAFWPAQHSHALRGRECSALYSFSHHWHEGMQPTRPQHIVCRLTQRESCPTHVSAFASLVTVFYILTRTRSWIACSPVIVGSLTCFSSIHLPNLAPLSSLPSVIAGYITRLPVTPRLPYTVNCKRILACHVTWLCRPSIHGLSTWSSQNMMWQVIGLLFTQSTIKKY